VVENINKNFFKHGASVGEYSQSGSVL